jgi:hypothetical protein
MRSRSLVRTARNKFLTHFNDRQLQAHVLNKVRPRGCQVSEKRHTTGKIRPPNEIRWR